MRNMPREGGGSITLRAFRRRAIVRIVVGDGEDVHREYVATNAQVREVRVCRASPWKEEFEEFQSVVGGSCMAALGGNLRLALEVGVSGPVQEIRYNVGWTSYARCVDGEPYSPPKTSERSGA